MIRKAIKSDASNIADVHVSTWRQAYSGILPQAFLDALCAKSRSKNWETQIEDLQTDIYVYSDKGAVSGFIAGGACRDEGLVGFDEIYAVYVSPERQSEGIGLALITQFFDSHSNSCSLWVLEDNQRARHFYLTIGFRPDGHSKEIKIGGQEFKEYRYIRR